MMKYLSAAAVLLFSSSAFATASTDVPEMDVGAGVAAVALAIGAAAIIREKFFRK